MPQVDEVPELVGDRVPAALLVGPGFDEDIAVLLVLVLDQSALEPISVERANFEDAAGRRDIDERQREQLFQLRCKLINPKPKLIFY